MGNVKKKKKNYVAIRIIKIVYSHSQILKFNKTRERERAREKKTNIYLNEQIITDSETASHTHDSEKKICFNFCVSLASSASSNFPCNFIIRKMLDFIIVTYF